MSDFLKRKISERAQSHLLRTLKSPFNGIDFSSNDYLGFARSIELKQKIESFLKIHPENSTGSTGSRLLSGNSDFAMALEQDIAKFHNAEAGIIFNSGYDANVGLLSAIGQRGDTFVCDELIHASLIDGARLSYANRYIFKHNDLDSLEEKLKNSKGNIFVITESIFSMDGDAAPLKDILYVCKRYHAHLIVDEAHATGVFGEHGKGLVNELGLEKNVFARIHTFGKALGCHGAIILGSEELKTYLINFARSFIYTTALPFHSLVAIKFAYELLTSSENQSLLRAKIQYFEQQSLPLKQKFIPSNSAIQSLIIPGNENCKKVALKLQKFSFDIKPILSPTVPEGKERLRICLHSYNSEQEINALLSKLNDLS